jgi:hypothetical protein
MSTRDCPVCERPVRDSVLCKYCTTTVSDALAEVPDLLTELQITATRQAVTGPRSTAGRSAEIPLPYGARASDATRQIVDTLMTWARSFPTTWHPPLTWHAPPTNGPTAAAYLRTNINRIRQHPMAEKIYDQLTAARAHAYTVIDRDPDLVPAGQCGADLDNGDRCTRTLYGDPDRSAVRCPDCGNSRDLDRTWMLQGARDLEWTAAEIGGVTAGVTAAMVRRYAQRGLIKPVGERRIGPARVTPTYRVGDLLDLLGAAKEAS